MKVPEYRGKESQGQVPGADNIRGQVEEWGDVRRIPRTQEI
jgi:hypothetical protein